MTLTFPECKAVNAFYDPERRQINMCYELLEHFYEIFAPDAGQDETKYAFLVKDGILPKERAARCEGEYAQLSRSWSKLLGPYLK